jgi:competence CoiA-like predicted nuclease
MTMKIKEINELLENPEIKEVLEAAIQEQCKERQDALDKKIQELEEAKKAGEKELFIKKQMLLSKANLYEAKLKTVYESKFNELSKKVSTDVFNFISESVNKVTKAVTEDATTASKIEKMQEAFSNAVRTMSPYFNINELAEANTELVEKYKKQLNAEKLENARLREKVLSDDLEVLVVKECAGYPLEKKTIIVNALKEVKPKTLVEAKEAIESIKASIREEAAKEVAEPVITEAVKPAVAPVKVAKDMKSSLVALAEDTKKRENTKKATAAVAAGSIEPLDIF